MKYPIRFFLTPHTNEVDNMVDAFGNYESIQEFLNIEFACGVENNIPLFLSDIVKCDDCERLVIYDGKVIETIFRDENGVIHDTSKKGVRIDITYDDATDEFLKYKIVKIRS